MKNIILILFLFCCKGYSEEVRYTKSGIPIKFYGLLDVDNINYHNSNTNTNSLIYQIIEKEKELIRNNSYISSSR
jgi:hypothetical protein